MRITLAILAVALCISSGVSAARSLQQLPTLSSSSPTASAPSPGPLTGGACALGALEQTAGFSTLLSLIQASSESSLLQALLSDGSEQATIFAPTDAGIEKTLDKMNVTPDDLLSNPSQLTSILQYHILPSQLSPADLKNGYSFNTLYEVKNVAQSVSIQGNGLSSTVVASASSAPIQGQQTACKFIIYPIDGLLLSSS